MDCRQGCGTFEPDEAGRVLDRLAGLEKVILNEDVEQALSLKPTVATHEDVD